MASGASAAQTNLSVAGLMLAVPPGARVRSGGGLVSSVVRIAGEFGSGRAAERESRRTPARPAAARRPAANGYIRLLGTGADCSALLASTSRLRQYSQSPTCAFTSARSEGDST